MHWSRDQWVITSIRCRDIVKRGPLHLRKKSRSCPASRFFADDITTDTFEGIINFFSNISLILHTNYIRIKNQNYSEMLLSKICT